MLLKHCKKFTAAEITELVKITKQEIAALATSSNKMSVLLIDSLDSTVLLLYVQDVPASVNMGLEVAESLPAGSGEDWLCWRSLN